MKKQFLFLALGLTLLCSCKKDTNNTEILPAPTGTLEGFVTLTDEFGVAIPYVNDPNYSGVKVSLDSTGYSATTDSNGKYLLKGIPSNAFYNFTFSKAGYGSYNNRNFQFTLAGGNAPLLTVNPTTLYKLSSTNVLSLTAVSNPPVRNISTITLTAALNNSNLGANNTMGALIFFSTKPNVSPTNYEGIIIPATVNASPSNVTTNINPANFYAYQSTLTGVSQTTVNYSFPVNTPLYFIAYGYSNGATSTYTTNSYINTIYGITVFPNLNATPSTIQSAVVQ